ncbi:MAG: thermonuclease family protein [Patescibacteria group bacterium]
MRSMYIKAIAIGVIVLVCGVGTYLSREKPKAFRKPIAISPETLYRVHNVLDGDTFEVEVKGVVEKVRMIGVDTPETVDPRKPPQCFGSEASNETKKLLTDHFVYLEIDPTQYFYDKFGRILAYVKLDEGLFVNRHLLEKGFAREYTYGKAYALSKEFKKIQKESQIKKNGLWAVCPELTKP